MRQIRYSVAISLDGYIAGPNAEFDWIVMDPDIDFAAMTDQFDTYLLGRRTFEVTRSLGQTEMSGVRTFVFSRTLQQRDYDDVTIVGENWRQVVQSLRDEEGKDIWLFGGGSLFRSFAEEGFVDTVEVAVIPVILGGGTPLIAEPSGRISLTLKEHTVYEKTGTVGLVYAVNSAVQP
ncbi:dihydrofolate reductase [Candidatus Poribacteria bacterium]|nr:dihydrofolate reductase [Candidatus Poribacteria bacterium]MYA99762.1 dihydrofolate reductase [Candidatus Poribacteria bacterium]